MNLGEKIKKARSELGLTQSQLAGDYITRNMLSKIENSTAIPSLPTISYLAMKLNIPAGYFLTDSDNISNDFLYLKAGALPDIKEAYSEKKYTKCIKLCEALSESDDEINFILSECYYNIAYANYINGDFTATIQNYNKSDFYSKLSIYSNQSKYQMINENKNFVSHMLAVHYISLGDFASAKSILMDLVNNTFPNTVKFKLFSDLEQCCINTSDYQSAYKYSQEKLVLLSKMQN